MSRWVGGWVTGVGECGVEELSVAASFIVRSLCWLNAFQMEFAFWDCGGLQALVAVQSGEFQIVHGIGAAEGFRGGPWDSEMDCCMGLQRRWTPNTKTIGTWRLATTWLSALSTAIMK